MEILRNLFRRSASSPGKFEIQTRPENTFKEIARQIDKDRTGYPVLWAPNGDGGELEGSYIEFYLDRTLKVPYQVVPFRTDWKTGTISLPDYAIQERIHGITNLYKADKVFVVCFDDLISTGTTIAIQLEAFYRLMTHGMISDIKLGSMIDQLGAADRGYTCFRRSNPIFENKEEMLDLYRQSESPLEFRKTVIGMRTSSLK